MAPNHAVKDLVALPALSEAKLRLYEAMRSQGVRKADLARRIVWHKSQMDQIETALKGLHLRLAVQVEHCAA
jgi:antitoxin HicB